MVTKTSRGEDGHWERDLPSKLQIFVEIWRAFEGTELSGAQQFLHSLLEIYEADFKPGEIFEQHPVRMPAHASSSPQGSLFPGETTKFTTQRMDLYLPKICVWEMKGPNERDLSKHHDQLLDYWARMRTRYMVLCNFREFWIYDTELPDGQLEPALRFDLENLPARGDALLFLRGLAPDLERRSETITADVARQLGRIVRGLIETNTDEKDHRERVAKFVLECVFAMYAEDTELIPPKMFTNALAQAEKTGQMHAVWSLFDDFGRKDARGKGNEFAPYVNGPLFDRNHPKLTLTPDLIHALYHAARDFDWQGVQPEIFGSIFEQALNPVERHELGAHFTRESDIARVVVPTVIEPWRERIAAIRNPKDCVRVVEQMRAFHVLDPACGCGNFLYVVYREMKRLEAALVAKWDSIHYGVAKRRKDIVPAPARPYFSIQQVHGIETNGFAAFLARVVLWIGEHLAKRELGLEEDTLPLKNLEKTVRHADALEVKWPRPDGELAIVGNPPYLGVRRMRHELGDEYVEKLFARFPDNRAADLVTYWFTRSLEVLRKGERAGFVCTNSIAQNESREASIDRVIERGGTIVDAWHSLVWPGDAAVHFAVINWVMDDYDGVKTLDGREVPSISPGLTDKPDVSGARVIEANANICFMGFTSGNVEFVLDAEQRAEILASDPGSSEVIRPFLSGRDLNREVKQGATRWIIDFGLMEQEEAEKFKGAMRHVRKYVYPLRKENRREAYAERWWRFVEARPSLRRETSHLKNVLALARHAPHLVIARCPANICFDSALMVIALSHRYHLGLLQSRIHEIWARALGSTLKGDLRYTNTTVFETFPFPRHADKSYDPRKRPTGEKYDRVATAATEFERVRAAECVKQNLGLTKLHNALADGTAPKALTEAWEELNDAVTAAYGFPKGTWRDEGDVLARLLKLNERASAAPLVE